MSRYIRWQSPANKGPGVSGRSRIIRRRVVAAGNATATPGTVAAVAAVPAPTVAAAAVVSPSTVVAVAAVPGPTVRAAAVASPSTVAAVASVPSPVLLAAAVASSSTVVGVATVPAPSVAGTAVVGPSTVVAVAAVPAPTITTVTIKRVRVLRAPRTNQGPRLRPRSRITQGQVAAITATATPATVVAVASVPSPGVLAGAIVTTSTVVAVAAVPSPSVAATAVVSPGTVVAIASVPAPSVSVGAVKRSRVVRAVRRVTGPVRALRSRILQGRVANTTPNATAAVSTVAAIASVPSAVIQAEQNWPGAVRAVQPWEQVFQGRLRSRIYRVRKALNVTASPGTVAAVASVPGPSVAAAAVVVPATVVAIASVPSPTVVVQAHATATPITVVAIAYVGSPVVIVPIHVEMVVRRLGSNENPHRLGPARTYHFTRTRRR